MLKTALFAALLVLSFQVRIPGPGGEALASAPTVTLSGLCDSGNVASLTSTCTSSGAGVTGDLVFISSKAQNTSGTGTMTPTAITGCGDPRVSGNEWVQIPPNTNGSGQAVDAAEAYCVLTSGQTPAVTVVWSGVSATATQTQLYVLHSSVGWNATLLDRYVTTVSASGATCPTGTTNTTSNPNDYVLLVCRTLATAETWASNPAGFTKLTATGSTRTGVFADLMNATGAQGTPITLSSNAATNAAAIAFQLGSATNCSGCTYDAGVNSSGQTVNHDQPTLSGTKNGSTGFYFGWYDNAATNGSVTMTDNTGRNIWCPYNAAASCGTVGGTATMNSLTVGGNYSMYAFVSSGLITGNGVSGSLIFESVASDCAVSCSTFIGGTASAWSAQGGTLDGSCNSASGATSGSGSNNASCPSFTTTKANELVVCGIKVPGGSTVSAGTSPVTFTLQTQSPAVQSNGVLLSGIIPTPGTYTINQTIAASGVSYGMMCAGIV